ncbi:MAG: TerD family protein, partial [Prevotella sp.]|nr:TerD family protein [Prevotella sp.]
NSGLFDFYRITYFTACLHKIFSSSDFDKSISIGDQLVFDKQSLKIVRIDLVWKGTDLDICAFLLGRDGLIHDKSDLVYFNSQLRWKPKKDFSDPHFNQFEGELSTWDKERNNFKNQRKWMAATLPVSSDGSVIGSWDDMADDEDGDCGETMYVLLEEIDTRKYESIVFAAVVAKERIKAGETFENAHDPVVNICDEEAEDDDLIAEYKLAQQFPGKDAVCFGKVVFDQESNLWSFEPMADSYKGGMEFLAREVFD